MTREEAIEVLHELDGQLYETQIVALKMAIKALEQEPCRDIKEIEEVINCDADAETKCKMISNILTAKPHYFEEQEPILDKITELVEPLRHLSFDEMSDIEWQILRVIDKYKAEIKSQESEE